MCCTLCVCGVAPLVPSLTHTPHTTAHTHTSYWRRLETAKSEPLMVELAIEWSIPYVAQEDWVLDTLPTRDEKVTMAKTRAVFHEKIVPEGISRSCADAAAAGDVAEVKARVKAGADIERPDAVRMGMTPLHRAAREGQDETVRALLEAGADVEARDADGMTALFHAAKANSKACCRVLARDYKCDKEARDKNGWTPLTHAVFFGKKLAVEYLLFAGVAVALVAVLLNAAATKLKEKDAEAV